jgi:hypothetical protein
MAVMSVPVRIMGTETHKLTNGIEHTCKPKQKLDVDRLTLWVCKESPLTNNVGTVVHLEENEIEPVPCSDRNIKSK